MASVLSLAVAEGQAKEQEAFGLIYEKYPEIIEAIEAGKTVGEILIDFTPGLGDAIVALKGAKSAYKAARKAELSGNIVEAQKNLDERKILINQYYTQINDLGDVSTNNKVKTQLKKELAFKEANVLNIDGALTRKAISDSSMIPLSDGVIKIQKLLKL